LATKNLRGKSVKVDFSGKSHRRNAYEVYQTRDGSWQWYVLKHYQTEEAEAANPYARVFCDVVSPIVGESGELGDTYLKDIKGSARLVAFRAVTDGVLDTQQTLVGLAPDGVRGDKFVL
jgi:Protein of unknown function (DUF995)